MTQICIRHGCRKQALRKFCSDACRIAHHNGRRPPAPKVKITCQGCGSVFQGRPDQKPAAPPVDLVFSGCGISALTNSLELTEHSQLTGSSPHRSLRRSFASGFKPKRLILRWSIVGYPSLPSLFESAKTATVLTNCIWTSVHPLTQMQVRLGQD